MVPRERVWAKPWFFLLGYVYIVCGHEKDKSDWEIEWEVEEEGTKRFSSNTAHAFYLLLDDPVRPGAQANARHYYNHMFYAADVCLVVQ
jgi:hypothetical protein